MTLPNIIFVTADDHALPAMNCYCSRGNATPNLDRIAKEVVRFDNGFYSITIRAPGRATIMTGRTAVVSCVSKWFMNNPG